MFDARRYLQEIVTPTVDDYAANVRSVRHGFLACLVTFHTLDYLAKGTHKDTMRTQMRKECPSFREIDGIAHALKHTAAAGNLRPEHVIERPPAVWDEAVWDLSRWDDEVGGVTLSSKTDLDLLKELNLALAYLWGKLPAVEDAWIAFIQAWAARDTRIASVHLFGSRAKGSHNANSDLDLAVLLTGEDITDRDDYAIRMAAKWKTELAALPVKVHLQWAKPESDATVWPAVLDHGQLWYRAPNT